MAMELIETIEVGAGGAASIEFTSIPQDADDLLLVFSGRGDLAATVLSYGITLNNDSGSGQYSYRQLRGTGSSVSSTSASGTYFLGGYVPGTSATANTFHNDQFYLTNYTSSTTKSASIDAVSENNGTTAYQTLLASSYLGTSAISSIQVNGLGYSFAQYSTASLYKITKA